MGADSTSPKKFTFALTSVKHGSLSTARQKACDRCRRRKQRCDAREPCVSCLQAGVYCTYLVPHHRTGRKPKKRRPPTSTVQETTETQGDTSYESQGDSEADASLGLGRGLGLGGQYGLHLEQGSQSTGSSYGSPSVGEIDTPCSIDAADGHYHLFSAGGLGNSPWSAGSAALDTWQPFAFPAGDLAPYVRLFLHRLYPIFPIFNETHFTRMIMAVRLRRGSDHADATKACEAYALLCTIAATVLVTLNLTSQNALEDALQSVPFDPIRGECGGQEVTFYSAAQLVSEALQIRQQWDFVDEPSEETLMTSFFLFAYFGNASRSRRAWYYLREAVGFALAMGLDDASSYTQLELADAQRRCRIFWLLFVTERAYALQHRSGVMLRPSIELPAIFGTENPKLMLGFVNLVTLFKSVDGGFVSAWKATEAVEYTGAAQAVVSTASSNNATSFPLVEISETQRLDYQVTQFWLLMLTWQLQNGITADSATAAIAAPRQTVASINPLLPFQISRQLLAVVSQADRNCLEVHGIGMEQKMFDIASCLSSVLEASPSLTSQSISTGHNFLHSIMKVLASFRNQESRYLQPLVARASTILSAGLITRGPAGTVICDEATEMEREEDQTLEVVRYL